ncbi:MAG: hypothetical protein MUP22_00185 [Desulfobacterales bacterium]|nr:hypothetical protein [Desulfobacterales bacterium]
MDYRGLSVIGVWGGALGITALFLRADFTTDFIMVMIMASLVLTVYIVRLKPGGSISEDVIKITNSLEDLGDRLATLEKNVKEISKLLED